MVNLIAYLLFFTVLLFVKILTSVNSTQTTNSYPYGLRLKLVHRSSLPSYRNEKLEDFLEKNKKKYMKNAKFSVQRPLFQPTSVHLYFVNLSIGDPPVQQYLSMDTGSSLVWVVGNPQERKYSYRSRNSRTYRYVECGSPECSSSPKFSCSKEGGPCTYQAIYADNVQLSIGYLGFDRFVFKIEDHKSATIDNVLFGIGTYIDGALFDYFNFYGILGLGPRNISFLRNIPRKFSYCIAKVTDHKVSDHDSAVSYLKLGEIDDDYWLTSTYLEVSPDSDYYRVDMECISLGGMCLIISPNVFKVDESDPYTGVVFDIGTVFTYLPDEAYDIVAEQVAGLMEATGFDDPIDEDTQLCYKGRTTEILDFPILYFHFTEDVDVSLMLDKDSLFYQDRLDKFCMSFIKSSTKGVHFKRLTIVGLLSQQNHTMGFDLDNSLLSIKFSSCVS